MVVSENPVENTNIELSGMVCGSQHKLLYPILNNIEVYEKLVQLKLRPHNEKRIVHESLNWGGRALLADLWVHR